MIVPIVILSAAAVAFIVVMAVGSNLPVQHQASVSRRLSATPEAVWSALTDLEGQVRWRTDLKALKVVSHDPVRWVETMKMGDVPMAVDHQEEPKVLVTRIDSDSLPYGGTWTFKLESDGPTTEVTITEDGFVKPPLFRFLSKFVFGHDRTLKGFADSLEAKFGKGAA